MRSDLIISGIPVLFENETTVQTTNIVNEVLEVLNVEVQPWELISSHRLKKRRNGDVPIIARFNRPEMRDKVLASAKAGCLRYKQSVGFALRSKTDRLEQNQVKVYLNEHLNRKNQVLLGKSKALREKGYKYVWSKNGSVFARKNDQSAVIKILNEQKLAELLGSSAGNAAANL